MLTVSVCVGVCGCVLEGVLGVRGWGTIKGNAQAMQKANRKHRLSRL